MGLINLLPNSRFGFKGNKPIFQLNPNPPASFHRTYSIDGVPQVSMISSVPNFIAPPPSRLDEGDPSNNNKYKNKIGKRYIDNLPK